MIMVPDSEQVFYKLSELSEMLGVETSVLRFWEKEFPQIKPMKVSPRKRLYRRKDFEVFREIKRLLYEERFTIAGAKKRLTQNESGQGLLFDDKRIDGLKSGDDYQAVFAELKAARQTIEAVRRDLMELKNLISRSLVFNMDHSQEKGLGLPSVNTVEGPIILKADDSSAERSEQPSAEVIAADPKARPGRD